MADYRDTMPRDRAGHDPAPWRVMPDSPAERMAAKRRDKQDTLVAHINPREADLLKAAGGRGTVNEKTGALEFATADNFDAAVYLAQNPDVAATGSDPWQHYQQYGQAEGRVARQEEVAARARGYGGPFGGGAYVNWENQQQAVTPAPTYDMGEFVDFGVRPDFNRDLVAHAQASGYAIDFNDIGEGQVQAWLNRLPAADAASMRAWIAANDPGYGARAPGGAAPGAPQPNGTSVPDNPGNTYTPRNYGRNVRNATPAGLAAYYQSQGMGRRPYGTVGGEHNFFPNRSYQLPEIVGLDDDDDDDDGGDGGGGAGGGSGGGGGGGDPQGRASRRL
jgi:hypothetical protein